MLQHIKVNPGGDCYDLAGNLFASTKKIGPGKFQLTLARVFPRDARGMFRPDDRLVALAISSTESELIKIVETRLAGVAADCGGWSATFQTS